MQSYFRFVKGVYQLDVNYHSDSHFFEVTYRWSKPKCTKHVTPNNKCYQWRIPVAADIEPREMEEGKTKELENMANICFNLPRKKQEIVSNSQIQKRGVKLFHRKNYLISSCKQDRKGISLGVTTEFCQCIQKKASPLNYINCRT